MRRVHRGFRLEIGAKCEGWVSNLVFTVTLSNDVQGGVKVNFASGDGTATTADNDYTTASGTLTFSGTAGETHTITVATTADTKVEADETLSLTLSNVVPQGPGVLAANFSTLLGNVSTAHRRTKPFRWRITARENSNPNR